MKIIVGNYYVIKSPHSKYDGMSCKILRQFSPEGYMFDALLDGLRITVCKDYLEEPLFYVPI